jgi:hypothetical protein
VSKVACLNVSGLIFLLEIFVVGSNVVRKSRREMVLGIYILRGE